MSSFAELGKFDVTQDDGAVWTTFYNRQNPERDYAVVTSAGKGLFLGEMGITPGGLRQAIAEYRKAELAGQEDVPERDFLGAGQQARVYGMGDLAVREIAGSQGIYKTLSELDSMDRLASIIDGGLPRWINVPHIYACYSDVEMQKRYMIMQRIDSGVTIEDIVDFPDMNEHSQTRVLRELGRVPTDEDKATLAKMYAEAEVIVRDGIEKKGQNPDQILVDWETRNVLVEPVRTPIAGQQYSLSIIDQYAA